MQVHYASMLGIYSLLFLLGVGAASPSFAEAPNQPEGQAEMGEDPPRLLVHLLDYLSTDYSGAVADGKVTSEEEYREQKEFSGRLLQLNRGLPATQSDPQIQKRLEDLNALVLAKADSRAVSALAQEIKSKVIRLASISLSPTVAPDLKSGRKSYERNCSPCHGLTGHGDGPSSFQLNPKPVDFYDAGKMAKLTPFQSFNAIRLGVPGTGMAGFPSLPDSEVWDLAFYVISLRHQSVMDRGHKIQVRLSLKDLATRSDEDLREHVISGKTTERSYELARLRTDFSAFGERAAALAFAREKLAQSLRACKEGNWEDAEKSALVAYLDGVEPVEPRLRARDAKMLVEVEARMGRVRSAIDLRRPAGEVEQRVLEATAILQQADAALTEAPSSPAMAFSIACGIFLREAFEAVLLLIVLLGVVRTLGSRSAVLAVHVGWLSALVVGALCWLFSGWIVAVSGLQREILEGSISLLAVGVLLYMGFWLHRKTEIGRWRAFIEEMARSAVGGKSLFGLAFVAFMAVFREAFEVVLFLRALLLESGPGARIPIFFGMASSLCLVLVLATCLLRFSARLPIKQLFDVCSLLMVFLAFTLMGKALHSFQESGIIPITELPFQVRVDLLGIYPTYQTFIPQLVIAFLCISLWIRGRKPSRLQGQAT